MRKIIIILISLLSLTGCNYKEINDVDFAAGLGVDFTDGKYVTTVELLDVSATEPIPLVVTASGANFVEAIENLQAQRIREIHWGNLQVLILGENVNEPQDFDGIRPTVRLARTTNAKEFFSGNSEVVSFAASEAAKNKNSPQFYENKTEGIVMLNCKDNEIEVVK